jgi:hypothetical protein
MIRINSFFPLANFSSYTLEFYEDKIISKTKSLKVDFQKEIVYEDIKSIINKETTDFGWFSISFLIIIGLISVGLCLQYFHFFTPGILIAEKVVAIIALALFIPALHKSEYYFFEDKNCKPLAMIKITKKNSENIYDVIKLIKQKTILTTEVYLDEPFPDTSPIFEYIEYDIPDFINKSIVKVYEDRIINIEKSLLERVITVVKYTELSGKITTSRYAKVNWGLLFWNWFMFIIILKVTTTVLLPLRLVNNPYYYSVFIIGLILLIPLFIMKFVKFDTLEFYDHGNNTVFWTRLNSKNQEILNKIVDFVQGKVANNKNV